jgi:hypothetical protein
MNSRAVLVSSHRFLLLIGILAAVAVSPARAAEDVSERAERFAQRFYATLLKEKPRGLPSEAQWTKLAPFFTSQIGAAMAKVRREEAAFARKHPGEVPPMSDGDLFSSLFEGPASFAVGAVRQKGDAFEVRVALTYGQGREHTEWTDVLVLTTQPTGLQVSDIRFGGKWAFKSGPSLRHTLGLAR